MEFKRHVSTELRHGGVKRVESFMAECGKWSFRITPVQNGYELHVKLSLGDLGKLCAVREVDSFESAKAMAEKFVREETENVNV